jgi:hypothetical protein
MIATEQPLIELLALIDLVWQDSGTSSGLGYSEQSLFKV